jgi:hypothetical protein
MSAALRGHCFVSAERSALVAYPRQREKIIYCYPADIAACHVREQALAKLEID